MNPTNQEMQLQKTCQLYAYLLALQAKNVPEEIQECSVSYEHLVDCVSDLAQELKDLDSDTFDRIVNNKESQRARDLSHWWDMYQMYIPVPK